MAITIPERWFVRRELDEAQWRGFVAANPAGNCFHTPEMFQVFQHAARYRPALWAVVDGQGCPLALMLPTEVSVLDGPLRSLSSRAIVFGGVLCQPSDAGREALSLLLREYTRQTIGTVFTEVRNMIDTTALQPALESNGFAFEGHLNYLIDLTQPEDVLWRRISRSARHDIRAAERKGVVIEDVADPAMVAEGYEVLRAIYHRVKVPLPDGSLFDTAFRMLHPRAMLRLFIARLDGRAIGATFNLVYKDTVFGWYGGADQVFWKYFPNELLNWHMIYWARQNGLRVFDFGGAGKPEEDYGPRVFKAKFGGELVNFGRNTCVHAPHLMRVSEAGYKVIRHLF